MIILYHIPIIVSTTFPPKKNQRNEV